MRPRGRPTLIRGLQALAVACLLMLTACGTAVGEEPVRIVQPARDQCHSLLVPPAPAPAAPSLHTALAVSSWPACTCCSSSCKAAAAAAGAAQRQQGPRSGCGSASSGGGRGGGRGDGSRRSGSRNFGGSKLCCPPLWRIEPRSLSSYRSQLLSTAADAPGGKAHHLRSLCAQMLPPLSFCS